MSRRRHLPHSRREGHGAHRDGLCMCAPVAVVVLLECGAAVPADFSVHETPTDTQPRSS